MADNPKKKGRDRELVSEQEHEVAYLMRTAKVTRQKALKAIREAGPNRENISARNNAQKSVTCWTSFVSGSKGGRIPPFVAFVSLIRAFSHAA